MSEVKRRKYHKDDDGRLTGDGDTISFSFGIPPLYVESLIIERDGKLFALTPDCSPKECRLDKLRSYVGAWYLKKSLWHNNGIFPESNHQSL